MTIFLSNLKRILRKRKNKLMIFLMPILVVYMGFKVINFGVNSSFTIGIVDNDKTELTQSLINGLENKYKVSFYSEDETKSKVQSKKLDYGIIIENGFTDKIIKGKDIQLKTYRADEGNVVYALSLNIENFMNSVKNIALSSAGDDKKFYSALKEYSNGNFSSEFKSIENNEKNGQKERYTLMFLAYCMLILSSFTTNIVIEDKKDNITSRMFTAPITPKSYMLSNVLSFMVILALQIFIAFTFMIKAFNAQLGASTVNMFIVFLIFGLCCTALNLAICNLSKDAKQASVLTLVINNLMAMVAGFFWPRDVMPDFLKTLGDFTPAAWLAKAVEKLLISPSLNIALQDIGIILLFTLIFFMIALKKKGIKVNA